MTDRLASARAAADRLDPVLGVFLRRTEDGARADGPLAGTLVGVKDNIATEDGPTTCQSAVHDDQWFAGRDATIVRRLRAAGAVVVGKTTLTEFAFSRPDDSGLPVPRNPWDVQRYPGGSSSGSAVGVAAGLFDAGIGTDTNGSIRMPAALCGVTGLKPTQGMLPADGCFPLSRSTESPGPIARTADECARLLAVMADRPFETVEVAAPRIGVPTGLLEQAGGLSEDCKAAFDTALDVLRAEGATIVPVDLPEAFPLMAAQLVTMLVDAYELHADRLRAHWAELSPFFRCTVAIGGVVSGSTYVKAQRTRAGAAARLRDRFADLDAVATPTLPSVAARYDDPAGVQSQTWLPAPWSATGFPALAVPMGFDPAGLPLSLQLAGVPWSDFRLTAIASRYQRATDWHTRTPDVVAGDDLAMPTIPSSPPPTDPAVSEALAARFAEEKLPVTDFELAVISAAYGSLGPLFGMLPPEAVDVAPIAEVRW